MISDYQAQLDEKVARLQQLLNTSPDIELEIFQSPPLHYRMRAEFKIWHQDGQAHYAMHEPGEKNKPYIITDFPQASKSITHLMPTLLEHINQNEILKHKLFQIEFLSTLTGEVLVTLIYHRTLNEQWLNTAKQMSETLHCSLIGRSRKQKLVLDKDFVIETLTVNQRQYQYQQVESSFTQPNAYVCEQMLSWACDACSKTTNQDLLELYCGNGNFTIPLSQYFNRVLATEISKTSVKSAIYNAELNNIKNISLLRMSSEEFSQAKDGLREFRRLKDMSLNDYDFSCVLVDPPRSGVDDHTLNIIKGIDTIIYISCNPETLKENLNTLLVSHQLEKVALFDQFPYTHHIECGVILKKR